jgi:hypothetical protein
MLSVSYAVRRPRLLGMVCCAPGQIIVDGLCCAPGNVGVMASAVYERVPRMVCVNSVLRLLSASLWVFLQAALACI